MLEKRPKKPDLCIANLRESVDVTGSPRGTGLFSSGPRPTSLWISWSHRNWLSNPMLLYYVLISRYSAKLCGVAMPLSNAVRILEHFLNRFQKLGQIEYVTGHNWSTSHFWVTFCDLSGDWHCCFFSYQIFTFEAWKMAHTLTCLASRQKHLLCLNFAPLHFLTRDYLLTLQAFFGQNLCVLNDLDTRFLMNINTQVN